MSHREEYQLDPRQFVISPSELFNQPHIAEQVRLVITRIPLSIPFYAKEHLCGNSAASIPVISGNYHDDWTDEEKSAYMATELELALARQQKIRELTGATSLIVPLPQHGVDFDTIDDEYTIDPSIHPEVDGILSFRRSLCVLMNYADCAPICILFMKGGKVVAIGQYHLSWRSAVAGMGKVVAETIKAAKESGLVDDTLVYVAPFAHEGTLVYGDFLKEIESVEDLRDFIRYETVSGVRHGALRLKKYIANILLEEVGLQPTNVEFDNKNTTTSQDLYSHSAASYTSRPHGRMGVGLTLL